MTRFALIFKLVAHLTTANDVSVGVVDGHVEAERLQQDVLVGDQLLSFFLIRIRPKN